MQEKNQNNNNNNNMKNNFDLKKFLTENKLTVNSKLISENKIDTLVLEDYKPGSTAPVDLYYSDKHGKLVAMDDVDDKYHSSLMFMYKKGDKIEDIDDEGGEGEGYYDRYPSGMIAPEDLYYSEKQSRLVAKGDKDRPIEDDDELELYYRKGEKIR